MLLVAAIFIIRVGVEGEGPSIWVDLREPKALAPANLGADTEQRLPIRVAISPIVSPEKSARRYQALIDYIARRLGRAPILLGRQTYMEIHELLRNQHCDLALVCTYAFIHGEQEFQLQALAAPMEAHGGLTYRSLILAQSGTAAKSLRDLRGKRFASADLLSTSGWLFPAVWLKERQIDPEHFFGEHLITGSHDRSVESVASGFADGAAVFDRVYEQMLRADPTLASKVVVIDRSPAFGLPPFVVHPKLDPELRQALRKVLTSVQEDLEGQEILRALNIERFVEPERELYDSVRQLVNRWEGRER